MEQGRLARHHNVDDKEKMEKGCSASDFWPEPDATFRLETVHEQLSIGAELTQNVGGQHQMSNESEADCHAAISLSYLQP